MSELHRVNGGEDQTKKAFVAVRTMDRRSFISPTQDAPDFFDLDILPDSITIESRVTGGMRSHHGIIVNSDHALSVPRDEHAIIGRAVYQRSIVDYEQSGAHGIFTPQDVNVMRRDLLAWSKDESDTFTEEEKRIFRIKEMLFQQVINLFNGRSPR